MARSGSWRKLSPPDMSTYVDELLAVPRSFAFGWFAGLLGPIAAMAGVVLGIYLFTKKVPFITEIAEEDGRRRLTIELVEPYEARSLIQRGTEAAQSFGDEIRSELEAEE
jgi:hypothetical protein